MASQHTDDAPVLEPTLTAHDRRLLSILPEYDSRSTVDLRGMSKWEVAERLRTEDVAGVRQQLDGLVHLHYAVRGLRSGAYYRSSRGVELLAADDAPTTPQEGMF